MDRLSNALDSAQRVWLALALLGAAACGDDDAMVDAGALPRDGGARDGGGAVDSGTGDSGAADAGGGADADTRTDAAMPVDAGDVGPCTHTLADLAGGWTDRGLFACFDGTDMWIGDNPAKLERAASCMVIDDGCGFRCMDGGDEFTGTLRLDGDTLNAMITDCPADPGKCAAAYMRDETIICGR
jgi:hypothetical protein